MGWTKPAHSKGAVDRAADRFIDPASSVLARREARVVINNWRAAHGYPLNTFQVNLRNRARRVDTDPLVAQRLKRLPSIEAKLRKEPFNLSQIQDIGGCRAVVFDIAAVDELVDAQRRGRGRHKLQRTTDYVRGKGPRPTGYRSVHMIYRHYTDGAPEFDSLLIEVQIRSRIQHAWATAVETAATFLRQPLKAGEGDPKWLRFFALMASEMAIQEGCPTVPGTPVARSELCEELRLLEEELSVLEKLAAFQQTLTVISHPLLARGPGWFVLERDSRGDELRVRTFGRTEGLARATEYYDELEQAESDREGYDVVLVSVDQLRALQRAYPNYFADTSEFLRMVADAVGKTYRPQTDKVWTQTG